MVVAGDRGNCKKVEQSDGDYLLMLDVTLVQSDH